MTKSVSLEVELKSPVERVWEALTDPATLSKWMMFETNDFRPVVGHRFQFRMQPDPKLERRRRLRGARGRKTAPPFLHLGGRGAIAPHHRDVDPHTD